MNLKNTIVDLKRRKWSLRNLDEVNAKRKLQSSGEVYKGKLHVHIYCLKTWKQ